MSIMKGDNSFQQQINEQSLTQDFEKTRELLKRKLQIRRSLQQLVDVGIIPSPKSSLSFYEQHKQLQMRKTQDILRNKILSRPNRQLLIEHNILSDTKAAPAIQKTQCQLKRARLIDNLNDKLSVRPGILELVANNIFQIDSNLKQGIQNGHTQYSRLSQQKTKRSLPKCLIFHEYKGPLKKVEITKVRLQSTLKSFEHNHYKSQLKQQQLFLELIQNQDKQLQSFETMKLSDLKNQCRKLNISSTGTKIKLIEKLKNAQNKIPSQIINNESLLNDQERQQQLVDLENHLEKFKQKIQQNTNVPLKSEYLEHVTTNDIISSLLDGNTDASSILDNSYSNTSSLTYMDRMAIPSPIYVNNNNPDFTQFLNHFDADHYYLYDSKY